MFKLKYSINRVEKPIFEAWLVAKGNSQREGIDYQDVFSTIVKHVYVRFLLNLDFEQLDINRCLFID